MSTARAPKYDFKNPANRHEPATFEPVLDSVVRLAVANWANTPRARALNLDAGQIATLSRAACTAQIGGFYRRQAAETPWANGEIIPVTDGGIGLGPKELEWGEASIRNPSQNLGLTALDMSPERAIEMAVHVKKASKKRHAHKILLGFHEMIEASHAGWNVEQQKGEALREQHMLDFNEAILRGLPAAGLRGVTSTPGIKRTHATVNWATANADVIYDDWSRAVRFVRTSAGLRERTIKPTRTIIPSTVDDHWSTELFNPGGTTDTLKMFLLNNNEGHQIIVDDSLRNADTFGHPGAILLYPENDMISVVAPVFAQLQQPQMVADNQWMMSIEIETIHYGVLMKDPRGVCFVDGGAAGWTV